MLVYKKNKIKEFYYENNKTVEKTYNFQPYCFVKANTFIPDFPEILRVEDTDFKTLFNEKLKKIIVKNPSSMKILKDNLKQTYEADLIPVKRFQIDNKDIIQEINENNNHIFYIDIETQDVDIHSNNEIVSIVIYSSIKKEYYQLTWKDNIKQEQYKNMNINTYKMHSEKAMLKKVIDIFNVLQPNTLTGWYFSSFDLPYLVNRMEKLKLNVKSLSPVNTYRWTNNNTKINIVGLYIMDYDNMYFDLQQNAADSKKLEYVAQQELGIGKTEESGALAFKIWEQGELNRLLQYNLQDVRLMILLEEKLKLFDFFYDLANFSNTPLNKLSNSNVIDNYVFSYCKKNKIALPTQHYGESRNIEGAKVMDPVPGLHKNVAVMDLASLYPSIMITFNISYETCNGFMNFKQDKKGLIPILLEDLFKMRKFYRKQGENNKQALVKRLMNSFYGVQLFQGFRLGKVDIGESITYIGRKTLEWSRKIAENEGFSVIGGDTDSIFVENITKEQAIKLAETINKSYDDFVAQWKLKKHRFNIEMEELCESWLSMDVKKRYAKLIDGEVHVKGMQVRRSDSPMLGRKIQETILKAVLTGNDEQKIKKYLKLQENRIRKDIISIEDIASPMGLQKKAKQYKNLPINLRAAQYSNKYLGYNFKQGDKLLLVYVKKVPIRYPKTDVIAIDRGDKVPEGFVLDINKIIEKNITKVVEPIFKVMNWNVNSERRLI